MTILLMFVPYEEIILFMILTTIVLYLAAVGIYHFEHEAHPEQFKSVFHSIWCAITILTTVGYGLSKLQCSSQRSGTHILW